MDMRSSKAALATNDPVPKESDADSPWRNGADAPVGGVMSTAIRTRVVRVDEHESDSISDELRRFGFPYDAPTELPAEAGAEIEAILEAGPPDWIRNLLAVELAKSVKE